MKIFFKTVFLVLTALNITTAQRVLSLNDALSIALKESYNVRSAEYNLLSSQKNLEAVKLGMRTSVNLQFDLPRYARNLSSQFNPSTGIEEFYEVGYTTFEGNLFFNQPIVYTNGTFSLVGSFWRRDQFNALRDIPLDYYTNLSLRLEQPLLTFNSQKAGLTRAEINLQKSERNFTRMQHEIIYNVSSAFYRLFQAKKNVEITKEKVNQTEISYTTAFNKFKAGLIAEVEALQLEVDLAASRNELLNAERNYKESKDDFKLLIGLNLEDDFDVTAELIYKPVKIEVQPAVELALQNRPELLNAESDIELQQLSLEEVDSKGNISALITANYGVNRADNEIKDLFREFAQDRSVVLSLQVPVLDWGMNSRLVESAEANLNLIKLTYENQKLQIEKEISSVVNKIESAKARVEVLSKSVEVAQKSYDISLARFEAGTITSFDLSQMQLKLTNAKTSSLDALIDYKLAISDLERKTLYKFDE